MKIPAEATCQLTSGYERKLPVGFIEIIWGENKIRVREKGNYSYNTRVQNFLRFTRSLLGSFIP